MTELPGDAPSGILRGPEIREILRAHMQSGTWTDLRTIYDIVEAHATLRPSDFEPAAAGTSDPRWHRNVRNVLQAWKEEPELEWDGDARYRRVSASETVE